MPSEGAVPSHSKARRVLGLCLPALLGFSGFLIAFPIDRHVPFWPNLSLAEAFGIWFLLVAPIATTVAILTFVKNRKLYSSFRKWLLITAITVSALLNLFVLLGLYAAAAF